MATATFPPPPRRTANPAPARPRDSVRRTSSIDVSWPEGELGDRLFVGRARDYRTPASGPGAVIEEAEFRAILAQDKTIISIATTPETPDIDQLVGVRGGNHLRLAIREAMPDLIARGAPLYLPLDDISGTALVSVFAWAQWNAEWAQQMRARMADGEYERMMADRVNVCWGLQEGNIGVSAGGPPPDIANADAGELRNPADPLGWHDLPETDGPGFRRARRIDVTSDGGVIRVESAFQDSAKQREGGRIAIHEYNLVVTADPATLEILTLEPEARILPFPECPGAVHNTQRLVGARLSDIRDEVLAQLRGPQGCTHLNDALRALAEVPKLARYLAVEA
jgi:hypothetical protein